MTKSAFYLINIVKHVVCGGEAPTLLPEDVENQQSTYARVMKLASIHDLEHIVAHFLLNDASAEISADFRTALKQTYDTELYRSLTFGTDLSRIGMILEAAGIDYIPLKGAVIRDIYPAAWMRSSSDIDILVRPDDLARAVEAITAEQGFMMVNESGHHTMIESKTGWITEMHFTLNPGNEDPKKILDTVWDHATPVTEGAHKYAMDDTFFYYYIIFHMAHHVKHDGACGIRTLLDLWALSQRGMQADGNELIEQAGLAKFAQGVELVAHQWFGDAAHADNFTDRDIAEIENFVIIGGISGTTDSAYLAERASKGDGAAYAARRIFLSYEELSKRYRDLQGKPKLTPLYQVKRWKKALLSGGKDRVKDEIARGKNTDESDLDRMNRILDKLELK